MAKKVDSDLEIGPDGKPRCFWHGGHADYMRYHDKEWGRPLSDDRKLFEKVCLEGFQSGLSWLTILRKRDQFRLAFQDFDFAKVAKYGSKEEARLIADAGIVRHRGKIKATINNAQRALEMQAEYGSLAAFFWQFEPPPAARPSRFTKEILMPMTSTPESKELSKQLKKRGWKFVGPTTMHAFMQSVGIVNDHFEGCWVRHEIEQMRAKFRRPTCRT